MLIRDCMKKNVFSVPATASVRDAINLLVSRHIGLLPVIGEGQKLVGVVGLRDLLSLALPSAFQLLDDLDYIGDFGALESYRPDEAILVQSIASLMRPATAVQEDSGLIRAYAILLQRDLHDLPVVDSAGHLTGIASRVDIGTKILSTWT